VGLLKSRLGYGKGRTRTCKKGHLCCGRQASSRMGLGAQLPATMPMQSYENMGRLIADTKCP